MNRLLTAIAVLAAIIVVPAAALGKPGQNGPRGPAGNPNADTAAPSTVGSGQSGAPGNSGSNPHGGPPGATAAQAQPSGAGAPSAAVSPSTSTAPAGRGANGAANLNGNGPAERVTICHATGSETNPHVVITISENGLHGHGRAGHQDDEDVIPAAADGSCSATTTTEPPGEPPTEPPGDVQDEGGNDRVAVLAEHGASPSGDGPSGEADDTLPFTGLFVGFLGLAGVMALAGGMGLRRAAGDGPPDSGELPGVSRRGAEVARETSVWAESVSARAGALAERLASFERSFPG